MFYRYNSWAFLGGTLTGERHSRDTRDDGMVTLCTLRAATVLSRDCRADFGRPSTKKVMSHSRDGRVSRHHCGQTLYLSPGCGIPPPSVTPPPLKKSRNSPETKSGHVNIFTRLFFRWINLCVASRTTDHNTDHA